MAGVPGFFVLLLLLVSSAHVAEPAPSSDNLQDACNKTLFPKVCIQALTTNPETRTADAHRLAELSVYVAKEVGTTVAAFAHHELNGVKEDKPLFKCLDSCSDDVEEAVAHLSALTRELTSTKFLEVKSWLSATLGGSSTCEESCKDAPISDVKNAVVTKSLEFEKLLRVTLDLITEASGSMSSDVAVPPTAWDASAPGSYGASAPESSESASAPESSESASAPSSDGSSSAPEASDSASAPKASDSASAPKASDSASAPKASDSASAPKASDSAGAPASSDGAKAPASSDSASAPGSGAPSSDAASPSNAPTSEAPSTDAPSPSAASGPSADTPSSSAPDADAPSSGSAGAPSSGDAGAPSSGDAGAPSPSGASAPDADSPA